MKNEISTFLSSRIEAGDFPSAVYLIAEKGDIVLRDALGYAVVEPERIEARFDTIYDLASLTKVLVTALVAAKLVERQELRVEDRVSEFIDDFGDADNSEITVRDLLTHTSGLPAWRPIYLEVERDTLPTGRVSAFIGRLPLAPRAGLAVAYSDLSFVVLQEVAERLLGMPLDEAFAREVSAPLGLTATRFNPPEEWRQRIAASETGNEYERQMIEEKHPEIRFPHSPIRNHLIWGEVHDGNAYFMGGVAGHAGLFSTAEEVFKIAQQFLPSYTTLLKPETCELFRTNFTPGMNEDRSFAFQLASTKDSTAGTRMSPQSFGHSGFTGTSLWINPVKDRVFVLLTNRTHNHSLPFTNINSVRRRFHDLAVEYLDRNS